MISQAQIKLIQSLDQKKFRKQHQLFVVEGEKMVEELLNSNFNIQHVYAVNEYILPATLKKFSFSNISEAELKKISTLKTPNKVLAVASIPENTINIASNSLIIALDNVQDPGNLGTIIRTACWFGISTLVCSPDTVDAYNPKVIQSTMGAIFKMDIHYTPLDEFLQNSIEANTPIYGTLLTGENMYKCRLNDCGIIVMGNESKGISQEIKKFISHPILIPGYPEGSVNIESLNVGVAAAIVMAEFRRPK